MIDITTDSEPKFCDCGCGELLTEKEGTQFITKINSARLACIRAWCFINEEHRDKWYGTDDGSSLLPVYDSKNYTRCYRCAGTGQVGDEKSRVMCDMCTGTGEDKSSGLIKSDRDLTLTLIVRDEASREAKGSSVQLGTYEDVSAFWNSKVDEGEELPSLFKKE